MTDGPFHPGLIACVNAIQYDFLARRGIIWMPSGDCTDMTGAIALMQKIDPGVQEIQTMAGAQRDTRYRREGRRWVALSWPTRAAGA